jgi:hypothetical protein
MRIRRVIITKVGSLADVPRVQEHPNVRGYWSLPQGYSLFEFYHPVYERIWDNDPAVSNPAWQEPSVKSQAAEAVAQEASLLAPLYRVVGNTSNAMTLMVPSKTSMYDFLGLGKGRIQWPQIGKSVDWEIARAIRVAGRLSETAPENVKELEIVIGEWSDCMKSVGALNEVEELAFRNNYFTANCSFAVPCGDATMALFMLFTETRYLTFLEAAGFFLPQDFSTPFLDIGGPGRSYQEAVH